MQEYVKDLREKGVLEPSRSAFNAPIFCVPKPGGKGLRIVLDYRRLNEASVEDKYIIREVQDCIDEIGRNESVFFSSMDLTAGFWQQTLEENSREYTAFTVPGMGRLQWTRSPMGLHGSPASFARLMDVVAEGVKGVITYLDDILAHSRTFEEHLGVLRNLFARLRKYNLKLNPAKCNFICKRVPYLGFVLTPGGVLPSEDKTKCIKEFEAPQTVKGIREFTGLCNYFRHFIPSYARVAGKLTKLLTKKGEWKGGELPKEAQEAFEELKHKLCSQPILDFPRPSRQFVLTTDAATGDAENPGGLGAVLTQVDPRTGQEKVIAYASRSLKTHERNYSAFLAELTAIVWAIDHFHWYLKGRQFVLQTDHKPLEKMNSRHTKTLNMLQIRLMEYNFIIRHKAGKENAVADFLSRNAERVLAELATVGLHTEPMAKLQAQDEFGGMMIKFLRFGELPGDRNKARWIQKTAEQCKMSKGILQIMDKEIEKIVLPTVLKQEIWQAFHCSQFGGHYGYLKTLARIRKGYWWPRMATEVKQMVEKCGTCRACKNPPGYKKNHAKFQTIEVPDVPNERVHMDLFGPLKVSPRGKKYVLVMTDAFTKYVEVVAIPDKTAEVVAEAFFERWICRYSIPRKVVTDRGWEFCAEFSEKLYKLLDIKHAKTASWHPQANSAAESFNRTMIKYMRVMLEEKDTLDWEQYLAPLMLCYNTAVHKSTSLSPFFLTFLHEPRLPYLDLEEEKDLLHG